MLEITYRYSYFPCSGWCTHLVRYAIICNQLLRTSNNVVISMSIMQLCSDHGDRSNMANLTESIWNWNLINFNHPLPLCRLENNFTKHWRGIANVLVISINVGKLIISIDVVFKCDQDTRKLKKIVCILCSGTQCVFSAKHCAYIISH